MFSNLAVIFLYVIVLGILFQVDQTFGNPSFNLYHHQVKVQVKYDGINQWFDAGSGTLITKSWVLCAAHLLDPINEEGIVLDVIQVKILYKPKNEDFQERKVQKWKIHDWFNDEGVRKDTPDFVLMELKDPVVGVVATANRKIPENEERTVVRYGRDHDENNVLI